MKVRDELSSSLFLHSGDGRGHRYTRPHSVSSSTNLGLGSGRLTTDSDEVNNVVRSCIFTQTRISSELTTDIKRSWVPVLDESRSVDRSRRDDGDIGPSCKYACRKELERYKRLRFKRRTTLRRQPQNRKGSGKGVDGWRS